MTIAESSPLIKQELEEQTFQRLMYYQKLFLSRIKNSPEERYKELLEQSPHVLQRVPHIKNTLVHALRLKSILINLSFGTPGLCQRDLINSLSSEEEVKLDWKILHN